MSFRLSFHLLLLSPTEAHWLDDPSDLTCKDSTQQHAVDDPLLSCKQLAGRSVGRDGPSQAAGQAWPRRGAPYRSVSDEWAAGRLGQLLAEQSRIDDLRTRADAGDYWAGNVDGWPPQLPAKQGNVEELRNRADDGNWFAGYWLTKLLAEQGRIEQLPIEVDAGAPTAGDQLRALLNERDQIQQAEQLRRWAINPDGTIAAGEDIRQA